MMDERQMGRMLEQLDNLQKTVDEIKKRLEDDYVTHERFQPVEENYVTKDQFNPVNRIVMTMVALILMGFFAVVTALVYAQKGVPIK